MAEILSKISSLKERASGAIEDVPDTLIGTIVALVLLTAVGLGILMFLGYLATR